MVVVDFALAKLNHTLWKMKLKRFLEDRETLTEETLVSYRNCELGKWLYSEGLKNYKGVPEIHQLERVHTDLHNLVKKVVRLKHGGSQLRAEQEYEKLGALSDEIITLLTVIEQEVKKAKGTVRN